MHFTRSYNVTPSVLITANHSTSESGNSAAVHNGITAWIEVGVKPRGKVQIYQTKSLTECCRVPNAADTGCCTLDFGECQPLCKNRQHKLIYQRLMLSSEYHTHAVKTKKRKLQYTRLKMGWSLQYKRNRKEKETNYNRLELTSDPVFGA